MKKLIIILLPLLFIIFPHAFYIGNLINYDELSCSIQNNRKIKIEHNKAYYLTFCSLYQDLDYFNELEKENINNKYLTIKTDSREEKILFQKEIMKYGTVYYAKINNEADDYINYMSFPATKWMNDNRENLFRLVEESEFNNLNIYYDIKAENEEKTDFDGIYYVSNENLEPITEIIKNIKVIDNNDGLIENISISLDEYTNKSEIGDYYVELKALDSSKNESKYRLLIKIVDCTKPVINLKTHSQRIETSVKKRLSYSDLLALVDVSDNTCDMTNRIRIKENEYFRNEEKNGEYRVTYYAMDLYGNYETMDLIIGVGEGDLTYSIEKYTTDNMSVDDICKKYFDNLGKKYDYVVTYDDYTGNEYNLGVYNIGISYQAEKLEYVKITITNILNENTNQSIEKTKSKFNIMLVIGPIIGVVIISGVIIFIYKKKKYNM